MSRRPLALLLVAALLTAAWFWWRSDRRRIGARLDEAIGAVSKSGDEDQITAFGKMRRLVGLFATGFVVLARPYEGSLSDPQELAAVVASYRARVTELHFVVRERRLSVDSARGTADMGLVLDSISVGGDGPSRRTFRFRLAWLRERGEWWIQEAELVEQEADGELLR
jgi:hypothetical protein